MQLDSKLPHVGTTIFSIMSRMAAESNAINLSQGFPDFNAPRELLDAVTEAMLSGQNQYAPQNGVEELRVAIAKKSKAIYGANLDKDQEITVSSGASEAIFNAVTAVIHPGDEAILFDPAYDCYEPAIRLAGGVAKRIPLKFPSYDYDWDQVRDTLSPKTRLIMINSPHNPTGKILRDQDIEALTTIVRDHHCVLISDEVYEHIVFDGEPHRSFLKYPELRERSFVISSFGKTYHATGWKIGYCVAPPDLSLEYRKVHQFNTFTSNTPMQIGLAKFMEQPNHYLELPTFYEKKRDHLRQVMQTSKFKPLACEGTYFQLFDYSQISKDKDTDFARTLTQEHGVATIPVSVFYENQDNHHVVRVCFAKDEATLSKAAELLCKI